MQATDQEIIEDAQGHLAWIDSEMRRYRWISSCWALLTVGACALFVYNTFFSGWSNCVGSLGLSGVLGYCLGSTVGYSRWLKKRRAFWSAYAWRCEIGDFGAAHAMLQPGEIAG